MTRARNITVFGTVLLASISLTSLRAEVTHRSPSERQSLGFGESVNDPENFFPEDRPIERTRADNTLVALARYEAGENSPAPPPPPPDPEQNGNQNGQPQNGQTDPGGPFPDGAYPEGYGGPYPEGPGGPFPAGPDGAFPPGPGEPPFGPGPGWGPPWAGDPGLGGPGCCDTFGPACGAPCGPACGPFCDAGCGPGGPVVIEKGWGDIFHGWGHCAPCGLVAGVEGTFLAPIDEPTQRVVLTDLVDYRRWEGDPQGWLGAGVRTWIGLQKCGWGFRVRYWHFGNDNIDPEPDVPVWAQPTIHESYHIEANTLDIELTQRFCCCCWQIDTSFGARYADLDRFSQILGTGTLGNGVDVYGLAWGANQIDGTGFTASIGGTRPIHPCSCWNFFWNFRGSVLWADSTVSAFTDAAAFTHDPPAVASARNHANAAADHKENVFIADAQLGLEYRIFLCRCPGQLAFRAGVEYQHWDTGDLLAQSESFAFLQGGPPEFGGESFASADAHDGDLDLIGFIFGVEWTY